MNIPLAVKKLAEIKKLLRNRNPTTEEKILIVNVASNLCVII